MVKSAKLLCHTILISAFMLTGLSQNNAQAQEYENEAVDIEISDPLEPVNRGIFQFNKALDKVIFDPVVWTYRKIVPKFGREMVHNATHNMLEPVTALNALLQGEMDDMANACGRFLTNSILGIGGLHDVAKEAGFERKEYGFDSTLKVYGVPSGIYLVMPILGPSSPRKVVGDIADYASNPFTYVFDGDTKAALAGVALVDSKDQYHEVVEHIELSAMDEYVTVRSLFAQTHIKDNGDES